MKKILLPLFLFYLAGCATHPARHPVTRPPALVGGGGITHMLVKGETVWRLSETYGVSARAILAANRIKDPTDLKVGTPIWIPGVQREVKTLPFLPDAKRWKYIIVHHSATEVGNAESFDKGHRKRGFWNGLGYHFVVDNGTGGTRDGQIETGHRWNHQMDGAHCNASDMNQKGIGICLVGNFDNEEVSPSQFNSLVWLVRQLQMKYKIPASHVLRHNEVPGKRGKTDCPGRRFPTSAFRKQIIS